MLKKLLVLLLLVWVSGASYVYFQSQQKPTDVYVATETLWTGEVISTSTGAVITGDLYTVSSWAVLWWKGSKPGGFHTGTVVISEGTLVAQSGDVKWGSFTMDMKSIKLLDINNPEFEGEIRDNFFEASAHPTVKFVITKTENQSSGFVVYWDLTIKGITKAISFPAKVAMNQNELWFAASFAIDRSLRSLTMREGTVNKYLEFNFDLGLTKSI